MIGIMFSHTQLIWVSCWDTLSSFAIGGIPFEIGKVLSIHDIPYEIDKAFGIDSIPYEICNYLKYLVFHVN